MQCRFAEIHLCMNVYVDAEADVHVNEICRSCGPLAKSFRCGRAGHSQQRGCFPRSPLCPFLPIRLQVCPYGESRVAVLTFKSSSMHVSTGRGCVRARRPEPAAVFNQRHILSYHSVSATPVRRTRRSLSSRPILLTLSRCPQAGSSCNATRCWGPAPPACTSPMAGRNPWASPLWSPCQICSHQNGRISASLCLFGLKFEPATDEEPLWFPCTRQARNDVRADAVALQRVCARRRGAPSADVALVDAALEWLHGSANVVAPRSLIGLKLGWTVNGHVLHLSCARQVPSSPSHAAAANSVWMCRRGEGVPLLHQRHGGDRRLIRRRAGPH